jgi:UDP-3-O-[3-hydroxymyristoyl] N-acetylglucosamine deacetylase
MRQSEISWIGGRLVNQRTLAQPAEAKGVGLHSGAEVHIRLVPAPPDTGFVFVRSDLGDFEIPANAEFVAHCSYATTLMRHGVVLSTVEHLLAALSGEGVDNCFIEVDNLELPIMDGSAQPFVDQIRSAGVVLQPEVRKALRIREHVKVTQGERSMSIEPADRFEIACEIDFDHRLIGRQTRHFVMEDGAFGRQIARARTFGFTQEIEALRSANLIRGGSLENAIVLGPQGMVNTEPLRFKDEFVRHKILDIIGDLALLGMSVLGSVTAVRSGHVLHSALMTKLLRNRNAWEIVDQPEAVLAGATMSAQAHTQSAGANWD